ncbi:branched-chain amino acid ABC transporter substrate-binding protein [Streptomyces sp. TRM 70351]|uniref:branched-chain amino acid ABC transporter substrate-binding protein n=1 Tax=Streptomyces sp. TRM 70351 TaxID=3116552 RepID=UPI002E7B54AF|nr:branched-chain amino acid ABC transporter substrate-binding protein [Streptomyces sp. TRM 70351]MEE1930519.1 branched-chain amino acid ABC transporter substrate-binding protein [Streptomyces sp. TRM 70351]
MLNKNLVKVVVPLAVGALALTGCGGESGGGGDTVRIAFQGPLSGDNVQLGQNMENGVKLAIDQANASGEYDFEIEYFPTDDQGQPDKATAAAQKAISENVIAVVGPAFSGPADTAAEYYAEAGIAAVSPSATRPDLTTKGYGSFLRAVPNDSAQGAGMARYFAESTDAEKIVVVDDTTDYGVGLADVAEASLKEAGLDVVRQSVPQKTPDYSAAAKNVVGANADGLIYAGYYEDAGPFATKLAEEDFEGIAISGDGTKDAQFVELAGSAANGWLLTCPCTDPTREEATKKFAEDYEAEFNQIPGTYSAESFDVANMIIEQVAATGGVDSDSGKLLEALRGVEHKGLTKTFSFDDKGEFTNQSIYLYEVKDGAIEYSGSIEELTQQ